MSKPIIKLEGEKITLICPKCRKVIKSGKLTPEEFTTVFSVNDINTCENCKTK